MGYKLKLDIFEGPLDLLLYLIKKSDIDIKDIPIAAITEQYMKYIDMMRMLDLDVVGDFLVMAATLMQIKSKMLLPVDPILDGAAEEDPRDELVRRLEEYKKFKEAAGLLEEHEANRKNYFSRVIPPEALQRLRDESADVYFDVNLFDLITALTDALQKAPEEVIHEIITDEHTVEQKIHEVLHCLLEFPRVTLTEMFSRCRSKVEMIVSFLAILELIRLREIKAVQKRHFSDIEIVRNVENIIPADQPPQS